MNYEIVIEQGCFQQQMQNLKPKLILVDSNVELPKVQAQVVTITTSEERKDFEKYFEIINIFEQYHLNRNDLVVIVGGGVLIDLAGFAASTYKRGIGYINVPTTTLSMIDSSVGSKNGLNYNQQKNLIGNITDPKRVIIDIDFLHTLDRRNFNNGLAEAIKIGYLGNQQIIAMLDGENINLEQLIECCVTEKLRYVNADKQDLGYRNRLNFGHTFGHAIESISNFKNYYHGEAISIGMVIASGYDPRLIAILNKYELPTRLDSSYNIEQLVTLMLGDKKNTSDKIKLILKNPNLTIGEYSPTQVIEMIKREIAIDNQKIDSPIKIPKSKSYIHRLIAGAVATKSSIDFTFDQQIDRSDDVVQSLNIVLLIGGLVHYNDQYITVDCRNISKPKQPIHIYKSATTYRMFTPILCALFGSVDIILDEQLKSRPHIVFDQFTNGITHQLEFTSNHYTIDGSISSQFISGYIIALVSQDVEATIEISGQLTSVPYIDMTIAIINKFGARVSRDNRVITILTRTNQQQTTFSSEPDYSSLGYFTVYNKLVEINKIHNKLDLIEPASSLQADSQLSKYLELDIIDMTDCPDLLPTLVAFGLLNKRGIILTNIDRIKYKECDRITAMLNNFADLEAITIEENKLIVKPVSHIGSRKITTYGDHRIAMACTIIAKFSQGSFVIDDYTVVHKSFPSFFEQIGGVK